MLLTDDQFETFLSDGYIVVQPTSLSDAFHEEMWRRADTLYRRVATGEFEQPHLETLGDNLRAQIPEIDQMLTDPAVAGAVQSILGENAYLHPHNFLHESTLKDQPFHQDGNLPWNERGHYRSHRPDWVILFYYPQAVSRANGPTEIVPSSQYWTTDIEREDGDWRRGDPVDERIRRSAYAADDLETRDEALAQSLENLGIPNLERRFIEVPRGSVVIGNYDLIHRGSRTQPDSAARYMFKFYYARTQEPRAPAWNHAATPPARARSDLQPVVDSVRSWSAGERLRSVLASAEITAAQADLTNGVEHEKVAAAYRLGSDTAAASLSILLDGLHSGAEATRRASAYGLRLRCDEAYAALREATRSDRASVRRFATFALGAAWSAGTEVLLERLESEPDDLARSNAAYALGQIARAADVSVEAIARTLLGRLQPGVEPNNTDVAGMPRSTVRQSVAYALLQLASNHTLSADLRVALFEIASDDPDRYVAAMVAEALAQGSEDAALIRLMSARRWVPAPASATAAVSGL